MTRFIFTFLFSFCLSLLMSAWVTFINLGFVSDFLNYWMIAFINAWPAAFCAALILTKPVSNVTAYITTKLRFS
ncbi:MAG: DUF2798 domain-containing protein [Paraglaciecola sp.]|uniref:DUF2798 domain-containing protein n=1 Tax=Paraglaciecola sp. TaxID=1920173 RepID=UPI003267320B